MRIGVILASHGEFARAALGAIEMIAGKQPDVVALGPTAEKSLETFVAERRTAYEELNASATSTSRDHRVDPGHAPTPPQGARPTHRPRGARVSRRPREGMG